MDHQFKRLLNLVRRTGDRLVVTDPNGEDTYVLMGLEAYESLADRLPSIESESWDKPCCSEDNFLDDYFDEDSDSEEFSVDDNWEVPDEFLTEEARARKNKSFEHPITDLKQKTSTQNFVPSESNLSTPSSPMSSEALVKEDSVPPTPEKTIWDTMPAAGEVVETWNPEKFTEEDKKVVEDKFENPVFSSQQSKKNDEDPGEEQFYLEPVE